VEREGEVINFNNRIISLILFDYESFSFGKYMLKKMFVLLSYPLLTKRSKI